MNRFGIGDVIIYKFLHYLSSCNPPRAIQLIVSLSMTLLDGQHII